MIVWHERRQRRHLWRGAVCAVYGPRMRAGWRRIVWSGADRGIDRRAPWGNIWLGAARDPAPLYSTRGRGAGAKSAPASSHCVVTVKRDGVGARKRPWSMPRTSLIVVNSTCLASVAYRVGGAAREVGAVVGRSGRGVRKSGRDDARWAWAGASSRWRPRRATRKAASGSVLTCL